MTVKKTVFSALLAVMSLTLYIVEGMIPPVVAIPGFRIGLAYFPFFSRCISAVGGKHMIPQ